MWLGVVEVYTDIDEYRPLSLVHSGSLHHYDKTFLIHKHSKSFSKKVIKGFIRGRSRGTSNNCI